MLLPMAAVFGLDEGGDVDLLLTDADSDGLLRRQGSYCICGGGWPQMDSALLFQNQPRRMMASSTLR